MTLVPLQLTPSRARRALIGDRFDRLPTVLLENLLPLAQRHGSQRHALRPSKAYSDS
jgi:hypothetical protein